MSRVKHRSEEITMQRKSRGPLGGHIRKMTFAERPGYHRRWVNDSPGRIQMFLSHDYDFVREEIKTGEGVESSSDGLGSIVEMTVGSNPDGSPLKAYLMEIRQEWYDEDQRKKDEPLKENDALIRSGKLKLSPNQYIPDGGIRIEN